MRIKLSKNSKSIPRSGIRKIFDKVLKLDDVINFSLGEPDFQTPEHVKRAAREAIEQGYTHYTPNCGLRDFREAVAEKVLLENRIGVDPETEVIATPGAMGALSLALYATIDKGDEVMIPDPGYVSYPAHVMMAGGSPVRVPLHEDNRFAPKAEDIRKRITSRTKAIILNYPANPTGSTLSNDDLNTIRRIAIENDLLVISDEVYERLTYDGVVHRSIASLPDMKENVISIFSLSKTYAMTGWRIGYAVGSKEVIGEMTKLQEHVSGHPSSISQKAGIAALSGPKEEANRLIDEFAERRDILCKRINDIDGISCLKPQGAFYIFMNVKNLKISSYDASMLFLEKGKVATVPGPEFGPSGEGYIRISYSVAKHKIESGMDRIEKTLAHTKRMG